MCRAPAMTEQDLALGLSRMGRRNPPLATLEGTGATCVGVGMKLKRWSKYSGVAFTQDDPRIEPCPTTGCWLWIGHVNARNGYGYAYAGEGKTGRTHRLVWETLIGPIPRGLVLDHICRVRSCCNPDHLRAVTQRQNVTQNSASVVAVNASRSVCGACGSDYFQKWGKRHCRNCRLRATRKFNAKKIEERKAQGKKQWTLRRRQASNGSKSTDEGSGL
jgi:hypothetical protein